MSNEVKPPWFVATNYDEAKNFTYKDWFDQLFKRYIIRESLQENRDKNIEWVTASFKTIKTETFPKMPEMPLIFNHTLQVPTNLEMVNDKNLILDNVWSTTTSEVALNFVKLTQNEEALNTLHPPKSNHDPNFSDDFIKPIINKGKIRLIDELEPLDFMGRRNLTIDLNGRETDIKKDFEAWLSISKQNYESCPFVQHVSDDKRKKWVITRIMAYFDLKIWAAIENQQVKNETMLDWIDEDGDYIHSIESETYRRKIYARLERELLNSTFFIRLFKTAYGENRSDSFTSILRDSISKHNIQKSDLNAESNAMADALKNWKPKEP